MGSKCKPDMPNSVPSKVSHSLAVCTLSIVPNTPLKAGLIIYLQEKVVTIVGLPLSSLTLPSAAFQKQQITNHAVKGPVILMVQSSLSLFGHFLVFGQNCSQHWWKCSWKGMKKPSVSPWTIGSRQVFLSAVLSSCFAQETADLSHLVPWSHHLLSYFCKNFRGRFAHFQHFSRFYWSETGSSGRCPILASSTCSLTTRLICANWMSPNPSSSSDSL